MPRWIIDSLIILGAAALIYFGGSYITLDKMPEPKLEKVDLTYEETAQLISESINTISPTPPTSETWVVTAIDFVENENLAYIDYHDTHNAFRILVSGNRSFKTVASFELESADPIKWRLAHGEDKAKGKVSSTYIYDPELEVWIEKERMSE